MLKNEYRKLIDKKKELDYECEILWKQEAEMLSKNITETIHFLDNDCTADEFSWMSEVFDDVALATRSKEFIECLWRGSKKFPEECKKYNVLAFIKSAEDIVNDKV